MEAKRLHAVGDENQGLVKRYFTTAGVDPFSTVEWSVRDVEVGDFRQQNVEAPVEWTDQSVGIVAKLYFATIDGVREHSVRQLIHRVAQKIVDGALNYEYVDENGRMVLYAELVYICLHQLATFNSPVWFNLGVPGRAQCASACFLLSVDDKMIGPGSIMDWCAKEAKIFKVGSGSGANLSKLRGSMEPLSTGGIASGPIAYMRTADAGAGTLKSGGAHRRAAKLVRLDADHPDIMDFIQCKVREDERMNILREAGIDLDPTTPEGERNIAECTAFQNENISVGASDIFMDSVEKDFVWSLKRRTDKTEHVGELIQAREIMQAIAEAAWKCADPGMQFDDTINRWHTTPSLGRITTSNPCGEVFQNDDSSCNLAALNLKKFWDGKVFLPDDFCAVVDTMILAMDVTCSFSDLPTPEIEKNTRELRQLGLGFSNLGATLMSQGVPYDSDKGRQVAAEIAALLTGRAYLRSAEIAGVMGAFEKFAENREPMLRVIDQHVDAVDRVFVDSAFANGRMIWQSAQKLGQINGFRNSQVTVLAPNGTTSFMMGCETTGVEPVFALVTRKKLAAAGETTVVCESVEEGLRAMGIHDGSTLEENLAEIQRGEVENMGFHVRHLLETAIGDNSISADGHLKMVAALQPLISGGISKTINLPNKATVEDIRNAYMDAWRLGIKGISVYRDGSKATQVLSAAPKKTQLEEMEDEAREQWNELTRRATPKTVPTKTKALLDGEKEVIIQLLDSSDPRIPKEWREGYVHIPSLQVSNPDSRRRMPTERESRTHKFSVNGYEGYVTAGEYPDGSLGEIFLTDIGKEGSTLRGMMNAWATTVSIALQYGVPLEVLARKLSHMNFAPEGATGNPEIPNARSIIDYIMRWLVSRYGDEDLAEELGVLTPAVKARMTERLDLDDLAARHPALDAVASLAGHSQQPRQEANGHICNCGTMMVRSGTCYTCPGCGVSTGC